MMLLLLAATTIIFVMLHSPSSPTSSSPPPWRPSPVDFPDRGNVFPGTPTPTSLPLVASTAPLPCYNDYIFDPRTTIQQLQMKSEPPWNVHQQFQECSMSTTPLLLLFGAKPRPPFPSFSSCLTCALCPLFPPASPLKPRGPTSATFSVNLLASPRGVLPPGTTPLPPSTCPPTTCGVADVPPDTTPLPPPSCPPTTCGVADLPPGITPLPPPSCPSDDTPAPATAPGPRTAAHAKGQVKRPAHRGLIGASATCTRSRRFFYASATNALTPMNAVDRTAAYSLATAEMLSLTFPWPDGLAVLAPHGCHQDPPAPAPPTLLFTPQSCPGCLAILQHRYLAPTLTPPWPLYPAVLVPHYPRDGCAAACAALPPRWHPGPAACSAIFPHGWNLALTFATAPPDAVFVPHYYRDDCAAACAALPPDWHSGLTECFTISLHGWNPALAFATNPPEAVFAPHYYRDDCAAARLALPPDWHSGLTECFTIFLHGWNPALTFAANPLALPRPLLCDLVDPPDVPFACTTHAPPSTPHVRRDWHAALLPHLWCPLVTSAMARSTSATPLVNLCEHAPPCGDMPPGITPLPPPTCPSNDMHGCRHVVPLAPGSHRRDDLPPLWPPSCFMTPPEAVWPRFSVSPTPRERHNRTAPASPAGAPASQHPRHRRLHRQHHHRPSLVRSLYENKPWLSSSASPSGPRALGATPPL